MNEFGNVNQDTLRLPVRQPPAARLRRAPGRRGARPRHGLPHGRDEVRARRARGRRGAGGRALCARAGDRPRRPLRGRRLPVPLGVSGGAVVVRNFSGDEHAVRSCVVCRGAVEARAPRRVRVLRTTRTRATAGATCSCSTPCARAWRGASRDSRCATSPSWTPATAASWAPRRCCAGAASPTARCCPGASCRGSSRTRASTIWATGSWGGRSRTACAWCAGIPALRLNVNVSHTQIGRTGFRDAVVGALDRTGFPPENLCIELTERCRAVDRDTLMAEMAFFRARGVKVALDDFGTGAASLNLVRNLPIDLLKIDRSFVSNIRESVADQGHRRRRGWASPGGWASRCASRGWRTPASWSSSPAFPWRATRASTTPARSWTWSICWPSGTELPAAAAPRPRGLAVLPSSPRVLPGRCLLLLSLCSAPVSPAR